MSNTSLAAQAVASLSPWLIVVALVAWCVPLLLLVPPAYRLASRQSRSLDPLWAVLLLGVANRIASDFAGVPAALQHVSATIMAAVLALAIWSYQRADH